MDMTGVDINTVLNHVKLSVGDEIHTIEGVFIVGHVNLSGGQCSCCSLSGLVYKIENDLGEVKYTAPAPDEAECRYCGKDIFIQENGSYWWTYADPTGTCTVRLDMGGKGRHEPKERK